MCSERTPRSSNACAFITRSDARLHKPPGSVPASKKAKSVLDLGVGPDFAAADFADTVGTQDRVLGLERSEAYVASGRRMAEQAGLHQLELRLQDLLSDPWPEESFYLIWCSWVAMFLPQWSPSLPVWTNASHRAGYSAV